MEKEKILRKIEKVLDIKDNTLRKINKTNQAEENAEYIGNYTKRKRLMGINKFLAKPDNMFFIYVGICLILYFLIIGMINYIQNINFKGLLIGEGLYSYDIGYFSSMLSFPIFNIAYVILVSFLFPYYKYKVTISFGDLNIGQKGTARWTTPEEIREQYKAITLRPELVDGKEIEFEGYGGIPISREDDTLYIDDTNTNNMIVGTTRSGKDETVLAQFIENLSRAKNKCSMIITDPKLEMACQQIPLLKKRGYDCKIINFIDPKYSSGYNPLELFVTEYEQGLKNDDTSTAERLAEQIAYTLFPPKENDPQPFFTNAPRDLFIGALYCMTEDAFEEDKKYNLYEKAKHELNQEQMAIKFYKKLYGEHYLDFRVKKIAVDVYNTYAKENEDIDYKVLKEEMLKHIIEYQKAVYTADNLLGKKEKTTFENISLENLKYIVEKFELKKETYKYEEYTEVKRARNKINIYSLYMFISALDSKGMLDNYFMSKPYNNFGRLKYSSMKSSNDKASGDIISTFFANITSYISKDVAKITAKSTIDFLDIGFGEKPMAVFIGIPDHDKSNDVIATLFLNQAYSFLAKMSTATPHGKVARRTHFILNEFANIPALDNISKQVRVGLGRDLIYTFVVQDYSSIHNIYKEDADSIKSNCGNLIYIKAGDTNTTEEISKRLGNETYTNLNRTGKKLSLNKEMTELQEERPLLSTSELESLKMGENVVIRTMFRKDLNGKPILATPIGNLGEERRFKYRYEYLDDILRGNVRLYKSPNWERIADRGTYDESTIEYLDVELEMTDEININNYVKEPNRTILQINNSTRLIEKDSIENIGALSFFTRLEEILPNKIKSSLVEIKRNIILETVEEETEKIQCYKLSELEELLFKLLKGATHEKKIGLKLYDYIKEFGVRI